MFIYTFSGLRETSPLPSYLKPDRGLERGSISYNRREGPFPTDRRDPLSSRSGVGLRTETEELDIYGKGRTSGPRNCHNLRDSVDQNPR